MTIDGTSAKEAYKAYFSKTEDTSSRFTVEVDGLNELDPLFMLEVVGDATLARRSELTATLIKGKKVEIFDGEDKVLNFTFNGGTLSMMFSEKPYLLQTLIDYCFATVLKKLTPPSRDSGETAAEKK